MLKKLTKLQLHTRILIGLVSEVIFGVIANWCGFSDFVSNYIKPIGSITEQEDIKIGAEPKKPTIMDILLPIFILVGRHFFLLKNKIMEGT